MPRDALPALPVAPAAVQWRNYRDLYDGFDWPHPVFELAFRWIEERLPPPRARATRSCTATSGTGIC